LSGTDSGGDTGLGMELRMDNGRSGSEGDSSGRMRVNRKDLASALKCLLQK